MKIIACCKVVPDEELIKVLPSRQLSLDETPTKISQYDLNALEAGKKLKADTGAVLTVLSIGSSAYLEPTKIRKDILSRGADDLKLIIDDSIAFEDSLQTAKAIAGAVKEIGDADLILCGTGSSDLYTQVTGVQAGTLLGYPTINNVTDIRIVNDGTIEVERTLENSVEVFSVALPAVLSVSSEINTPGVPTMKEIMSAGKKPVNVLASVGDNTASASILSELVPEQQDRRQEIIEGDNDEAVDALVAFLKKEAL